MCSQPKQIDDYSAFNLLESVKVGYNAFAEHWHASRQNMWYEFALAVQYIQPNITVLDIGCGNGRFYEFLQQHQGSVRYTGIDNSQELINIATSEHPQGNFLVGDALQLPHADNSVDIVTSFAVLHHITPKSNRAQFLGEISRVLKPGGKAFITVWNVHQSKYKKYASNYTFAKFKQYCRHPLNVSFGKNDFLIPFGEQKILRYVHGFTPTELVTLVQKELTVTEQLFTLKDQLTEHWLESRNICICAQKTNLLS